MAQFMFFLFEGSHMGHAQGETMPDCPPDDFGPLKRYCCRALKDELWFLFFVGVLGGLI